MALITSLHPTYALLRNPWEAGNFEVDLKRFARLVKGKLRKPATLITNPTAADIYRIASVGRCAVDIETGPGSGLPSHTGKDPTRATLRTIGIGNQEEGCSFVWKDAAPSVAQAIRNVLQSPGITKLFHNGVWFDLRVLQRYGLDVVNWEDTRDFRRALSATSPLSLRYLASLYDDTNPWKESEEDDEKGLIFTDNMEDLKRYNAQDTVETARVDAGMQAEDEAGSARVVALYQQHKQLSAIAAEMHTHGVAVDKQTREYLAWGLLEEFKEREALLLSAINIPGFAAQPNHIRALIYKRHAVGNYKQYARFNLPDPIDPSMWVDPRNPVTISVDFSSLLRLLIDPGCPPKLREIIGLYWDCTEVWKRRSTFVVSQLVDEAIGSDGRLRPGWNTCGTDTGRWSCSSPNIMNIEQFIRHMYKAAPGCVLVHGDKSQLELRMMAAIAEDEVLSAALASGDVYTADARDIFSIPAGQEVKKDARKTAKIGHLGFQYGCGLSTFYSQMLAQDWKLKFQTASFVHGALHRRYHRTVSYWAEEMERVRKVGYSETRIMQRRRVYPAPPELSEVANYPVQGTAGDIMNIETIELYTRLKKHVPSAKVLIQLHDALDVEVPARHARLVERIMGDVMNSEYEVNNRKHAFPLEIKTSDSWGDL